MRSWSPHYSEAKQFVKEFYIVPKLCSLTCATHTSREMLQRCVLLFWTLLLVITNTLNYDFIFFFFLSLACDVPALEARRSCKLPRRAHITYYTIYLDTKSTLRTSWTTLSKTSILRSTFSHCISLTLIFAHWPTFVYIYLQSYALTYSRMELCIFNFWYNQMHSS